MSDHIHFGSLEHAERERLARLEEETKKRLDKLKGVAGADAGTSKKSTEHAAEAQELSASSQAAIARQQELKESIAKRKRARELAVPTNDNAVKLKLREFGEPICLFAEGAPERRERLREVMAAKLTHDDAKGELRGAEVLKDAEASIKPFLRHQKKERTEVGGQKDELFYTEGSAALKAARGWIATYSLEHAVKRLADERADAQRKCGDPASEVSAYKTLEHHLVAVENQLSNFGDDRPVSFVAFSPGSAMCATGSWSAVIKLWSIPSCSGITTLRGHTERISGLAWHPGANSTQSPSAANLVSGGCDGLAKLWSLESSRPVGELRGHAGRLSRVAFHPSGRFVGTASFDTSWRLWDVETCSELLLQEGHTRALYAIAFHPDGSLVATAGLDAVVRVWDLRSGKSVQVVQGHVKQILALDFAPNGTMLASGSDDHTIRLWDLRKRKSAYVIPAHSSLISHVRFQPHHGRFLLSTSYDNKVKLWSMRDFSLMKTMEGHEGRVMCADVSDDGQYFATAAMDHTWKLWGRS
uniref:Pre-mRNA processing factor 4 (PRP4)-like domain-containing protein n=1 Tax=Calcidiscus leptoporus TaxID=127549 RepID=A0A7S0IV16_9EUKA|mmetsp:Transcript_24378/g.56674  ORF Transcript_24378/g.56674 Transcript_24378/m.56674 type:complete len:529 (+) Transcript_24378:20-1606(+)